MFMVRDSLPVGEDDILKSIEREDLTDVLPPGLKMDDIVRGDMEADVVSEDDEEKWRKTEGFPAVYIEQSESYEDSSRYIVFDFSNPNEEIRRIVDNVLETDYEYSAEAGREFGELMKKISDERIDSYLMVSDIDEEIVEALSEDSKDDTSRLNINQLGGPSSKSRLVATVSDIPEELVWGDDWFYLKMTGESEYPQIASFNDNTGNPLIHQVKNMLQDNLERNPYFISGYYSEAGLI